MKNKEIEYKEDIVCPFCKKTLLKLEWTEYEICGHTIFIATDHGFEYIRDDMKHLIDEDSSDGDYDRYTAQLPITGIRLAQYVPAPSFMGAYWGFDD